jgi:hypothetical protein
MEAGPPQSRFADEAILSISEPGPQPDLAHGPPRNSQHQKGKRKGGEQANKEANDFLGGSQSENLQSAPASDANSFFTRIP